MRDPTIRRLTSLEESASTARVLNLGATYRQFPDDSSLDERPFFRNRILNRCIFVKHRVRPNEVDLFAKPHSTVTKILAPIDSSDLKLGARAVMVGQRDFEGSLDDVLGDALKPGSPDRQVLDLIDRLPSFDPFLLREHLRRHGFRPARGYFAISDPDIQRMYAFVRKEVERLAALSTEGDSEAAQRLVERVLSDRNDGVSTPLKETLRLSDEEFDDGIFCWRGFLYFKWVLSDLTALKPRLLRQIATLQPRGPSNADTQGYLFDARRRLSANIAATLGAVERMIGVYDCAYSSLTLDSRPTAFRDFLLEAPAELVSLGQHVGAVQHVASYWRYRFSDPKATPPSPHELADTFLDFEDAFTELGDPARRRKVA